MTLYLFLVNKEAETELTRFSNSNHCLVEAHKDPVLMNNYG